MTGWRRDQNHEQMEQSCCWHGEGDVLQVEKGLSWGHSDPCPRASENSPGPPLCPVGDTCNPWLLAVEGVNQSQRVRDLFFPSHSTTLPFKYTWTFAKKNRTERLGSRCGGARPQRAPAAASGEAPQGTAFLQDALSPPSQRLTPRCVQTPRLSKEHIGRGRGRPHVTKPQHLPRKMSVSQQRSLGKHSNPTKR